LGEFSHHWAVENSAVNFMHYVTLTKYGLGYNLSEFKKKTHPVTLITQARVIHVLPISVAPRSFLIHLLLSQSIFEFVTARSVGANRKQEKNSARQQICRQHCLQNTGYIIITENCCM
jgi:hypothetical protein